MRGKVIWRSRQNQPVGYVERDHGGRHPSRHYCVNHNYVYYPDSWVDKNTGTSYKKGYYDENGQYYADICFKQNGRYTNVMCACEYCGTKVTRDLDDHTPLICPQCGGPLQVQSALDEYTQDPAYSRAMSGEVKEREHKNRKLRFGLIIGAIVLFLLIIGHATNDPEPVRVYAQPSVQQMDEYGPTDPEEVYNPDLFGTVLYLDQTEEGYVISEDGDKSYDLILCWDEAEEGYCDKGHDTVLWYNAQVDPPLWQYWFRDISEDFGDCGWMEYWPDGWFIEESPGNWIPLPEQYEDVPIWHMAIDPADYT